MDRKPLTLKGIPQADVLRAWRSVPRSVRHKLLVDYGRNVTVNRFTARLPVTFHAPGTIPSPGSLTL